MKKHLFFAATAALVLASCSSDSVDFTQADVLQAQDDNSVQFDTYMGKTGTTRADYVKGPIVNDEPTNDNSLKNAKFGVFAYNTSAETDAGANYDRENVSTAPSNIAPNFMYNQQITWSASSPTGWVYTPVKYWPNGLDAADTHQGSGKSSQKKFQKLSFFAYAPYKAMADFTTPGTGTSGVEFPTALSSGSDFKTASGTNGIIAMTTNEFKGNVWVKYLMPKAQEDEAVDLLWGLRGSASYSETDNSANAGTVGTNYNINLTKQIVGEKVAFLFKHALTKIGGQTVETENTNETPDVDKVGFKIVADVDVNTEATTGDHDNQATYFGTDFNKGQTLITLKSIKIQDGKTATDDTETSVTGITTTGIANSGWFNIETGTWSNQTSTGDGSKISIVAESKDANQANATDDKYSINPDIREATGYTASSGAGPKKLSSDGATWDNAQKPTGIYTTAVPVFAKETVPGITLIPGGSAQKIYITVDYLVRTADPNLENGYSEVEQVISNEINLSSLQPNKYYTIIIHLGMTSVKFEAVVADWQTTVDGTYTENGTFTPGSGDDANPIESHIWLPSNVVVVTP